MTAPVLLDLKVNAGRVLAVNLISLSLKGMTGWEFCMERALGEKSWGWKEAKGEVMGRKGCSQAVWWLRPCPALDFWPSFPFDASPLEFGALQQQLQ